MGMGGGGMRGVGRGLVGVVGDVGMGVWWIFAFLRRSVYEVLRFSQQYVSKHKLDEMELSGGPKWGSPVRVPSSNSQKE